MHLNIYIMHFAKGIVSRFFTEFAYFIACEEYFTMIFHTSIEKERFLLGYLYGLNNFNRKLKDSETSV